MNKILFDEQAQEKLLKGIETLYKAVSSTLGARSSLVGIAKHNDSKIYERTIVKDGVTVAKAIDLKDPFEDFGAKIVTEAAQKTVDQVGDGTTVTIILAYALIKEAYKIIAAGTSPMALRQGLEEGVDFLVRKIEELSVPVTTLEQKIAVATISSGDTQLGKLIAETIHEVGDDGVVTVEESKSDTTIVEHLDGMPLETGYISEYFVTDPNTMEAVLENARVLVTDIVVSNFMDFIPFLPEVFVKTGQPLVIIAPDINGNALESFIGNKMQGKLMSLCIRAPLFGDMQRETLRDIAAYTGSTFIAKDAGNKLKEINLYDLGFISKVTASKSASYLYRVGETTSAIQERIEGIKTQLKDVDGDWEKQKLTERLGKLTNGIAVIKVGGETEIEMKERLERVKDATESTKAAIRGGIVGGGETIYGRIEYVLDNTLPEQVLKNAIRHPFAKLMINAGFDPGEVGEKLRIRQEDTPFTLGLDVVDGEIKELPRAGIIDPSLVHISALKNALSVALQIMQTKTVIVPDIEKK